MTPKKAEIEWITKEQGGRTKPPLGIGDPPYSTVVRFLDEPWPPASTAWSLVIRKDDSLSSEYEWIADVHYLVKHAPHESLQEGREFELYEGNKRVAIGKLIEG